MSPLSELAKSVFITTSKGAGVTLASTVASCYLACQIEVRAHRFIYHHWPEKYATVEHANGLTQDELDRAKQMLVTVQPEAVDLTVFATDKQAKTSSSIASISRLPIFATLDQTNQFWKEAEEPLAVIKEFTMPNQDVIACSMTA